MSMAKEFIIGLQAAQGQSEQSEAIDRFLGLNPAALLHLQDFIRSANLDREAISDALFERVLEAAALRQLIAKGHWDGQMPQLERGLLGALMHPEERHENSADLRAVGCDLRRSGLGARWVLAAYRHPVAAVLPALIKATKDQPEILAECIDALFQAVLGDAGQVLDAYVEAQTERAALAEQESAALLEAIPVGVALVDKELQVLRANRALTGMFGHVTSEEVQRRRLPEVTHMPALGDALRDLLRNSDARHNLLLPCEGEAGRRHYLCDLVPLTGEGGAVALVTLRDRSEAMAQREAAERFRAAIDICGDTILLIDPAAMRYVDCNETACASLGYTRKELLALGPQDVHAEASLEALETAYRRLTTVGGFGEVLQTRFQRRDGETFPVEILRRALRIGGKDLIVASVRNLNEREQAAVRLQDSETLYRHTFEFAAVGVAHVAPDGRWIRVNQRLCDIVGYSREELLARTFQDITHPDDLDADMQQVGAMLRGEIERYEMEKRYLRKDGSIVWILLTVALVKEEAGEPRHFISVVEDINDKVLAREEKRLVMQDLEARVQERTAALEAANRELETFSYSLSHDLRAPLRSIGGFAVALQNRYREQLDDIGVGYLARIREATLRMDRLIEEMMNLARVAQAPLAPASLQLDRIASEVMESLRAAEPARRVEWQATPCEPVQADPVLMRDVLENLLGNAWKFSGQRELARIAFGCEAGEGGQTVFFVRDNGAGFDTALAAKLFRPLERLHHQEDFPGTGLGLASVERIITRHGGRVWAEGAPDQGAVFRFTLGAQEVACAAVNDLETHSGGRV